MKKKMHFDGMIFVPEGEQSKVQVQEVMLSEQEQQEWFETFTEGIRRGTGFRITISAKGADKPITIGFGHIGKTSAFAMLSYDVGDQPEYIHGFVAFLPKVNAAEDKKTIDQIRKFAVLRKIKPESFDIPLKDNKPVVATFFADLQSANHPPLHNIIRMLGAAFFNQFGIGSDYN